MSRPIVFRVYDKEKNKMFGKKHLHSFDTSIYPNFPSIYEIMQFTGYMDKKSIEICEGDIVELLFNAIGIEIWKEKAIVEWRDGELVMHVIKGANNLRKGEWFEHFNDEENRKWKEEDIEIIGNVYENPELL